MTLFVVGSLHLDVVLRAAHLPALDETVAGTGVDYVFGGKGGNQAIAAARMGATVSFAGRAGSDEFGDTLRTVLQENNVECSQLQRDQGPSGMSAAIVDANGDYGAVIVSAANLRIDPGAISIPGTTDLVLLQNEVPEMVNLQVAQAAKAQGAQVWLNAAPARPISDDLWNAVDLMIVNRVEAQAYAAQAKDVLTLTTLGVDGVEFEGRRYPAFPVEAISSHGAGDMFVGALAAKVVQGERISDAITFAQAAAALHVSSELPMRNRLSAKSVTAFLETQARR